MASFNFIGVPGAQSAAADYSYLLDQLDIKENQLSSDGNLSPGDYKLLTSMAQSAYSHPGLTPSQRSQILVKISGYQKAASTQQISQNANTTDLNGQIQDTMAQATMLRGNDPAGFLKAKADTLSSALSQLKDAIDTADEAGSDSSALTNQYLSTLSDYNDTTSALQDVQTYQTNPTGKPDSDFAAYITTNSKGEITDVQVGKQGAISGYSEVKALYGGLPIYGKLNSKVNGQNTFKLGSQTFTAPDFSFPDPNNPGAVKSNPLVSTDQQQSQGGYTTAAASDSYVDMDPKTTQPQGFIPDQGWAQGAVSSTFYQNNGGGKYTKYVNASQKALNIPDGGFISIPNSMEQSISPAVGTTTDLSAPINAPLPQAMAPNTSTSTPATAGVPSSQGAPTSATPPQTSRTQAPVSRSPGFIGGIAGNAINKAGGFLSNLFGGGNKGGQQ